MKTIARHQITLFFLLTVSLTWAIWIPAAIAKLNGVDSPLAPVSPLGSLARWTPGLVAIFLTAILAGKAGVKALFRPLRTGRVNFLWYAFALFFQAGLFFAAKEFDTLLGNSYPVNSPLVAMYGVQAMAMIPGVVLFGVPGSLAEELGWRGFALPRLQRKANALAASLVIGLIWGLWHLPALIYSGERDVFSLSMPVLGTIPAAILYTWLYNNTRGSLLLVSLFHLGQQMATNLLGTLPTYTDDILAWLVALFIVAIAGLANLSKTQARVTTPEQPVPS